MSDHSFDQSLDQGLSKKKFIASSAALLAGYCTVAFVYTMLLKESAWWSSSIYAGAVSIVGHVVLAAGLFPVLAYGSAAQRSTVFRAFVIAVLITIPTVITLVSFTFDFTETE